MAEAIQSILPKNTGKDLGYKFRAFRTTPLGEWCIDRISTHARVVRWGRLKYDPDRHTAGEYGEHEDDVSGSATGNAKTKTEEKTQFPRL